MNECNKKVVNTKYVYVGTPSSGMPSRMKGLLVRHAAATYAIVALHGVEVMPFRLNDMPLTALIVSGAGSLNTWSD